jgi:pyrroloquinoline quinone biosynthesis protein B
MKPAPNFILLILALLLVNLAGLQAGTANPYLYVLGVAQDAAYPQAGCYQEHCMPGWEDPRLRKGATSLALIDPEHGKKFLFEATPNLPQQLYQLERQAPGDRFELSGIFLTHAHIGHYAGLLHLGHEVMGASGIPVFAMPRMSAFLKHNGPWSQLVDFGNIILVPLVSGQAQTAGSTRVTPFLVPHRDEFSETVGYRIDGPNKSVIFIPDIDKWSLWDRDIAELVKSVDYALIDATFFADGELPNRDMSKVRHPFVTESMEALEQLSPDHRAKVWFIHLNHSNPLLNPESPASGRVRAAGFNTASEGLRLGL